MAQLQYIDLVNRVRDRFNEVRLTTSNWATTVGFDQFTKDAVNYAYHDILNAEMQWPFLVQSTIFQTVPGTRGYNPIITAPSGFSSPVELKEIDWDSFNIVSNDTVTTISSEAHTIPSTAPYSVSVNNLSTWSGDVGVIYSNTTPFVGVTGDPSQGQYTIINGTYYFNSADAGASINISYTTAKDPSVASVIAPVQLMYMDLDEFRQAHLSISANPSSDGRSTPVAVTKTNAMGRFILWPTPDKIYNINYSYWLDPLDMVNTTDVPLIPSHFQQIIIDGAQKYCHEFREDPQMSQLADKRFMAGIQRMRTELINRDYTMRSGFRWNARSYSNTLSTPNPR